MDSLVALMMCYNWHYGFVSVISNMRRGSDSSVDVHKSGVDIFASLFLMELKSMFHRAHLDMILDDNVHIVTTIFSPFLINCRTSISEGFDFNAEIVDCPQDPRP